MEHNASCPFDIRAVLTEPELSKLSNRALGAYLKVIAAYLENKRLRVNLHSLAELVGETETDTLALLPEIQVVIGAPSGMDWNRGRTYLTPRHVVQAVAAQQVGSKPGKNGNIGHKVEVVQAVAGPEVGTDMGGGGRRSVVRSGISDPEQKLQTTNHKKPAIVLAHPHQAETTQLGVSLSFQEDFTGTEETDLTALTEEIPEGPQADMFGGIPDYTEVRRKNPQPADVLWPVWCEVLGKSEPYPKLTTKRREIVNAVYREQLRSKASIMPPRALFRRMCEEVRDEPGWLQENRDRQMPEIVWRKEEWRDRYARRALEAPKSTPTGGKYAHLYDNE